MKNCVKCGTPLFRIAKGEWFCPNHGVIVENQEWKKKEKDKQNDD